MYQFTFWMDEVDQYEDIFIEQSSSVAQGAVKHTKYRGTVQQQGTPQNAANFNKLEQGVFDAHAAIALLLNLARQNAWEIEHGEVTLTNSYAYPFNNSKQTVALSHISEDYIVIPEVDTFDGNVGDVVVTDKLVNGFKIEFTGSAASAKIKYTVIGGILK